MKDFLLNMMSAMMPFMKPLVWLALAAFVIGIILAFVQGEATRKLARATFWIVLIIGIFFVVAQFMGLWLGAQPSINFGDSKKFEFILVPFWQLGLGALVAAVIMRLAMRNQS